jgi:hypothetical protein
MIGEFRPVERARKSQLPVSRPFGTHPHDVLRASGLSVSLDYFLPGAKFCQLVMRLMVGAAVSAGMLTRNRPLGAGL